MQAQGLVQHTKVPYKVAGIIHLRDFIHTLQSVQLAQRTLPPQLPYWWNSPPEGESLGSDG